MTRTRSLRFMVFAAFVWMASPACFGQMTIPCERVDSDEQEIWSLYVYSSAYSSTPAFDFDYWLYSKNETFVEWDEFVNAVDGPSQSHALLSIVASNPDGWGATVNVPQVTLGIGGNLQALCDDQDPEAGAYSEADVNSDAWFFRSPSYARGTYEVLGDDEDGTLYGFMDIIITLNGVGDWRVHPDGSKDEWTVTCGSSVLIGNRTAENDGWDVEGVLYNDGSSTEYFAFWPDNVNEIILVDEDVHSGNERDVAIKIERMQMTCAAGTMSMEDESTSALVASFAFSSSFEVESD